MSNILKDLLEELKSDKLNKTASAPNEPQSPEQQNADVLETSQAMIAKIDNFLQQIGGASADPNLESQGTGNDGLQPDGTTGGDPNDPTNQGGSSVHIEVPAGMSVKLASCDPVDSDSALRTIIGILPSYFGE